MAEHLIENARTRFRSLVTAYEGALTNRTVSEGLKIEIKNILENLRSALDYSARDCLLSTDAKIYFPIAFPGSDRAAFASLVDKKMPGLAKMRPDLVDLLSSFQEFHSPKNAWLAALAELSNENKHERLTPQKRTETARIKAQRQSGGSISWNPGAVRFGTGVSILGSPVDPQTQLPHPAEGLQVTREIWVDFVFESVGHSVLPLLREMLDGVAGIVATLKARLA